MYSKVIALLWERWKTTRWALIAACLSPLLGPLMYKTGYTTLENAIHFTNTFWYIIFLMLMFYLLLGQCETKNVDVAFPKRLFRFPVRTTTLVMVYMGYGIVAIALPYLIIIGINELFFDLISDRWITLLIFITVYITLQTFSWVGWPVLVFGLVLWVIGMIMLPFFTYTYHPNILCPIIILVCCTISFLSVSAYRHGSWIKGFQWIGSLLDIFRRKPSKSFESPLQAQIWFEMRQAGYLFPITALCFIVPMMGYVIFSVVYMAVFNRQYAPIVTFMFGATIVAAFVAGLLVYGVFYGDYSSGALSFWLRRPMTTRTLAVARLHAMMRSVGYLIAIFAVVTLAVVAHDWAIGMLDVKGLSPVKWALKYSSPIETVTMTVLGLYGFFLLYWIFLRMAFPLNGVLAAVAIIILLMRPFIGDVAVLLVWVVLIISLPISVLVAFYVARRRNLISTATAVYSACMFPVTVVSMWAFPWWLTTKWSASKGLHSLEQFQIILCIMAAILPFIPVVATPLIMDRLRHR